jgi:hypothetical protein
MENGMLLIWVQREMGEKKRHVLPQSFKSRWGKSQKWSRISTFDENRNIRIGRLTCLLLETFDRFGLAYTVAMADAKKVEPLTQSA